jgi:hypothetical protein
MIRVVAAVLAVFAAGCRSTLTVPASAPGGGFNPNTYTAPAPAAADSLRAITTPTGLQSAYNAVALKTVNIFDEANANPAPLVSVAGTVVLTKPVRVASGSVTVPAAGTSRARLVWLGEDPPILLISNNGGPSKNVAFRGVDIYAPNARRIYDFDPVTHTGSAYNLEFSDCTLTDNRGPHINLNAPGPGGRAYNWKFRNIQIEGTGPIAWNDNAHAAPIVLFEGIRCVNKHLSGPAFDLWNVGAVIRDCWVELDTTTVLNERGAFSLIHWENNYIEPHGAPPNGEIARVDGTGCVLAADAIYFVMPVQHVTAANGGAVTFTGNPDCTDAGGGHPDWTQPLEHYADLLRQCFTAADPRSIITWPAGRIDAAGLHRVNETAAVQQERTRD